MIEIVLCIHVLCIHRHILFSLLKTPLSYLQSLHVEIWSKTKGDKISQLILLADAVSVDHDVFVQVNYPTDGTLMKNFIFIFLVGKWRITKTCFMRYRLHCRGASQNGAIIWCAVWDGGKTKKKYSFFVGDNSRADLPMSDLCGFFASRWLPALGNLAGTFPVLQPACKYC